MQGDRVHRAADDGTAPELRALARVVARLRAEVVELEAAAATSAVVERARGAVMARTGLSADAAYEALIDRAARGRRSLLEECWITLGRTGAHPAAPPPGAGPEPRRAEDTGPTGRRSPLARLARDLAGARTEDDVAGLLRAALAQPAGVDAVLLCTRAAAGSLEPAGRAGVDDAAAVRWGPVPPLGDAAALEALATHRPVWVEEPERDPDRPAPAGEPGGRWLSQAWLPVPAPGGRPAVVGFLRTRPGPFDARTRTLLLRAVRLCGGRLPAGREPYRAEPADADVDAVQKVLDALSGTAVLLTPLRSRDGEVEDFRIDAAAPGSVDVAGRRGKELVGRRVLETYPTVAGTALWEGYLDTLATGTVHEGEPFTYEDVGSGVQQRSVYSVRANRLGERLVVSWVRHDTDARETRRLTDMQRLGNLGWAGWNLAADTVAWSDQVYAVLDRDPALGPLPLEELPQHLMAEDLPRLTAAVRRLLHDGEAVDEPFRITTTGGVRHLRIVAEAQRDADGTPVEVQGFFQDLSAQRTAELALRESERANLVQLGMLTAERTLAARLQDTLLPIPEQSLTLAHLCVDVAYLPADSGLNVGGDWYSAIELPDGSALFVVGDVAGHGLAAVGAMAQLRFTAKGMAVTGSALPDVLRRLNTLLLHTAVEAEGATATMVMARYRPRDHRLTWVRAGHLPPLLIRDGEAVFLQQPRGSLLGAAFESSYEQATIDLLPGDHLLLYTDGLVERPGEDIGEGLARLADEALELVREGRHTSVARTLAARRPGNRDDICVLDIRVPEAPGEAVSGCCGR